jgi:hypothetical protein
MELSIQTSGSNLSTDSQRYLELIVVVEGLLISLGY